VLRVDEIIKRIEYPGDKLPRKELIEIIENKETAIPYLVKILEELKNNPEKFKEDPEYYGHFFAVYLLAQFRETSALPVILDIMRFPSKLLDELFGDMITGGLSKILASLYPGDIQYLRELIEDETTYVYVKVAAMQALAALVVNGQLSREEVINYYRKILNEYNAKKDNIEDDDIRFITLSITYCSALYPEELYDQIEQAYENELVDEFFINLDDIHRTLIEDKISVLEETKNDYHYQLIYDTVKELEHWYCFNQNKIWDTGNIAREDKNFPEPQNCKGIYDQQPIKKGRKIGRNEPCPCGSGKKYKKCCGKNI
jgi:hypothetical protein